MKVLPLGAEHFFCALWNHPDLAIIGWFFWFMWKILGFLSFYYREQRIKEFIGKLRTNPTKFRAFLAVAYRLILTGPVLVSVVMYAFIPFDNTEITLLIAVIHSSFLLSVFFLCCFKLLENFKYSRFEFISMIILFVILLSSPVTYIMPHIVRTLIQ